MFCEKIRVQTRSFTDVGRVLCPRFRQPLPLRCGFGRTADLIPPDCSEIPKRLFVDCRPHRSWPEKSNLKKLARICNRQVGQRISIPTPVPHDGASGSRPM